MNKIYIFINKICTLINIFSYLPSDKKSLTILNKFLKLLLRKTSDYKELYRYSTSDIFNYLKIGYCYQIMREKVRHILKNIIEIDREATAEQLKKFSNHYKDYNGPKILIISHEFSLTGAPKAVLLLAQTLKNIYGKSPVVYSLFDGPIRQEFIDNKIELVSDSIPIRAKNIHDILSKFDIIIANSWCYRAFNILKQIKVPKIWWCHEIFTSVNQYEYVKQFIPCLSAFWAGSPCTLSNVSSLCKPQNSKLVLYGMEKISLPKKEHHEFTFSLFGSITSRKGQDIFINAIRKLPSEMIAKSKFYIIGKGENDSYHLSIINKIDKIKANIEILPQMSFENLLNYYALSDVIVVPSRYDPMPIIATYSFMFSIPCICSDSTGTAQLVENGKNGLIFTSGQAKELAIQMQRIFEDKKLYKKISLAAENVYRDNFDMKTFENKIKQEIDLEMERKHV